MIELSVSEVEMVDGGVDMEHVAEASAALGGAAAVVGAEPVAAFFFGFAAGIEIGLALS